MHSFTKVLTVLLSVLFLVIGILADDWMVKVGFLAGASLLSGNFTAEELERSNAHARTWIVFFRFLSVLGFVVLIFMTIRYYLPMALDKLDQH